MECFVRFAYPIIIYIFVPLVLMLAWMRSKWHKSTIYCYTLADLCASQKLTTHHPYKKIFFLVRIILLLILAFLLAKPQLVDPKSHVMVEGIDIVLTLDVSGSMQFQDYKDDKRSRLDIAKAEAIRFIQKRDNDALGLVIFGNDALSRCPLTADKNILKDIVNELHIGVIDPDGTLLSTALITAVNRLKHSQAKSKIIILLTDGEPSDKDSDPKVAIDVAKKLGIKVYTIGIGSDEERLFMHPFYGVVAYPKVNKELLTKIAHETGGHFFLAKDSEDMRSIYDTIDKLEKSEHEMPIFTHYYDYFMPFIWLVGVLILFELIMSSLIWLTI